MNISAKELAKLINVSPATVSMVFNNKPGISDATRELVLKTAAEYGYAPKKNESSGASSRIIQLVNYKKHGKVAADTPFFSQLTEGISTECTRQGCALHISYFYETMDIDSQLDALRAVDCEGILLLATEMAPSDFRKFRDFSVPIVVVDCYYDELDYDCVLINNIQGAFNATNYLIQCGHKNVGYFHSTSATSPNAPTATTKRSVQTVSAPRIHMSTRFPLPRTRATATCCAFSSRKLRSQMLTLPTMTSSLRPPCVRCVKMATASRRMSPSSALMTFRCAI